MFGRRRILILALAVVPLLGAVAWFLSPQLPLGARNGEHLQKPGEESKKVYPVGPLFEVGERIINLADTGGRRYLKIALTLEFEAPDKEFQRLEGIERAEKEKRFRSDIAPMYPLMQDAIIGILTSKTAGQVSSLDGKETLKAEMKERLNALLPGHKVNGIFITQFVVQ